MDPSYALIRQLRSEIGEERRRHSEDVRELRKRVLQLELQQISIVGYGATALFLFLSALTIILILTRGA
jgi:hypothetical protein